MNIKCHLSVQMNFLKKQGRMHQSHAMASLKTGKKQVACVYEGHQRKAF